MSHGGEEIVSVAGEVENHSPQITQAGLGSACRSYDWKSPEFSLIAHGPSSCIEMGGLTVYGGQNNSFGIRQN